MQGVQVITREIIDGRLYVSTESRGSQYCLTHLGTGWMVRSRRAALGAFGLGTVRHFDTLADVAAGCKVFGSAESLTELVFGVPA